MYLPFISCDLSLNLKVPFKSYVLWLVYFQMTLVEESWAGLASGFNEKLLVEHKRFANLRSMKLNEEAKRMARARRKYHIPILPNTHC